MCRRACVRLVASVCHDRSSFSPVGADRRSRRARGSNISALARAYLYSDLSPDDRIAAEGAMIMLLDDPSPLVRYALADALGCKRRRARGGGARAGQRPAGHRDTSCWSARRCCSTPIWSIPSPSAAPQIAERDRAPRDTAALGLGRDRRSRLGRGLPDADRESRRRHRGVLARPHRRSASGIWRRSASRCSPGRTFRPRSATRWWSSCPRRSRASWSRATGWKRAGRSASRRKPARRRP